jgi:hypothetical protein
MRNQDIKGRITLGFGEIESISMWQPPPSAEPFNDPTLRCDFIWLPPLKGLCLSLSAYGSLRYRAGPWCRRWVDGRDSSPFQ